jgi:rubrerythrin
MDARAALQQAIEFEERSAEFYRKNADEMPDPVLRAVLAHLADVEVEHVASVRRAFEASDLAPDAGSAQEPEGDSTRLDSQLGAIIDQANEALHNGSQAYIAIYQTALEFEREAAAFYRRAATVHPELGPFFTTMALVEALHVNMMARIVEANRTR